MSPWEKEALNHILCANFHVLNIPIMVDLKLQSGRRRNFKIPKSLTTGSGGPVNFFLYIPADLPAKRSALMLVSPVLASFLPKLSTSLKAIHPMQCMRGMMGFLLL